MIFNAADNFFYPYFTYVSNQLNFISFIIQYFNHNMEYKDPINYDPRALIKNAQNAGKVIQPGSGGLNEAGDGA